MAPDLKSAAGRAAAGGAGRRGRMGPFAWLRENLFSSWGNSLLTLIGLALALWAGVEVVDWALVSATFVGSEGKDCARPGAGACWPFITHKLGLFLYGRYPEPERWRVDLTYALALAGLVPLMVPRVPGKLWLSIRSRCSAARLVLLTGGVFGLAHVDGTQLWGGLLVTLVVATVGIAASFPLGILLALGRRSQLPIVRWARSRSSSSCAACRSSPCCSWPP